MLAECPPTVVPHFLETAVRAVEERHVLGHPFPRFGVGDGLYNVFILHGVEIVDVVLVVVVLQEGWCVADGRTTISNNGFCMQGCDGKHGFWVALAGLIKNAVPVGGCVDIGESAL